MTKRELLVVDNRPLRQRSFLAAQKVLEKIERLEEKIRRFHSTDQKMFNDWLELTFRSQRTKHEEAQNKWMELARFQNWVVATARMLKIEMHTAYRLMVEEQIRWNNGNEEERGKIALDRERREAFLREKHRSRYSGSFDFDNESHEDPTTGGIDGLSEILDQVEEIILGEDCDALRTAEERIDRLSALTDECLAMYMAMKDTGFMLFDIALSWGQAHDDYTLFKRIWPALGESHKDYFAKVYASMTETPIEDLLQELGMSCDWKNSQKENEEEDDGSEEPLLDRSFKDLPRSQKLKRQEAASEELLKSTFRKLMRKLHPDVHASESKDGKLPPWAQRMWALVRKAYDTKDLKSLERLLKLTQIRMNTLDELSISEIAEAKHWLKRDLENLEEESQGLRNSLAWNFSGKKKYDSLKKRIEADFARNLRIVMEEIMELEEQHAVWELLSDRAFRPQRREHYHRRQRSRRRRDQMEFSFED